MEWNAGISLQWGDLERVLSGNYPGELPAISAPKQQSKNKSVRYYSNVPFAELHAASSYNFLRGAASPEKMVNTAINCGLTGLALLDRDGFYGAIDFAQAAQGTSLATVYGAELSLPEAILTVLCKGPKGYQLLSQLIATARMAGDKDTTHYPPLVDIATALAGQCYILAGPEWYPRINTLREIFDDRNVIVEYVVSLSPEDADNFEAAKRITGLRKVATTRACAATRAEVKLAAAKQALAKLESVEQAYPELHPMGASWLRSGDVIDCPPELLHEAAALAEECAFELKLIAPNLPSWGDDEQQLLEELVWQRFPTRYLRKEQGLRDRAKTQIQHELSVINQLGFPGYFLIVCDLVDFAKSQNILCQGRGSAASSAVCYVLGITNTDPVAAGLLFERFLSPEREGPPDIDVDFESGKREVVIQYVYEKYGRENAAQVANVISYRTKAAIRDAGRALGYAQGIIDNWASGIHTPPTVVLELAEQLKGQPRHLGVHSGGMVICDRPIATVVPVEWARKENRSVVQWDKDGCAAAGLVKFDLLGLGMLEALHHMIDLVQETTGETINLWELDLDDPKVYEMLSKGDAVGVFQVESRAQLATLPRMRPKCFFDLVVEVALIRPGPIQGGSVHPYLRRRDGDEPVTYDHPCLEKALAKTLGVPLFQEQIMQVAIDAAGFSGGEADELRRAMGSKRSTERMTAMKTRFYQGLAETNNISGETADDLWNKIIAFANFGFPESHAQSFASLAYFSAWFKLYHPTEFYVGLLRAQPLGFYSPQSLLADARRRGIRILPICVNQSKAHATLENGGIRLGLDLVQKVADPIRLETHAPYVGKGELVRKAGLDSAGLIGLSQSGALRCLGVDRRQVAWAAETLASESESMLPGLTKMDAPPLPTMNAFELVASEIVATGVSHGLHPMEMLRAYLDARGVVTANKLSTFANGTRLEVAGVVTHRQRPTTGIGIVFLGMEDETGLMNIVISQGLWNRQRVVARTAKALIVRGIVQKRDGAVALSADQLTQFPYVSKGSRDFR